MSFASRLNAVNALPRRDGDVTFYHSPVPTPPAAAPPLNLTTTAPAGDRLRVSAGDGRAAPAAAAENERLRQSAVARRADLLDRLARGAPDFVYVNGVSTDPTGHRTDARGLSLVTDASLVLGVYNATAGPNRLPPGPFAADRARDLLALLLPPVRLTLEGPVNALIGGLPSFGDFYQAGGDWLTNLIFFALDGVARLAGPFVPAGDLRRWRRDTARAFLAPNPAALTVAEVVEDFLLANRRPLVVCYSQGTVITSNALHAVRFARGLAFLSAELFVCAPVPPTWPALNPRPRLYATTLDVVPLLSLNPFIVGRFAADVSDRVITGRSLDFDPDTILARHSLLDSYVVAANLSLVDDLRASLGRPPRRR